MIWNINRQIEALLEQEIVNPDTGEVTFTPIGLADLKLKLDEQVTGFIHAMRYEEARLEAITREANRLKELKEKTLNKIERAKTCLGIILGEGNRWQLGVHNISWRKSSAVVIDDEALVPEEFKETKIVKTISKSRAKPELEGGIKIPGCHLETKNNIQVN